MMDLGKVDIVLCEDERWAERWAVFETDACRILGKGGYLSDLICSRLI